MGIEKKEFALQPKTENAFEFMISKNVLLINKPNNSDYDSKMSYYYLNTWCPYHVCNAVLALLAVTLVEVVTYTLSFSAT